LKGPKVRRQRILSQVEAERTPVEKGNTGSLGVRSERGSECMGKCDYDVEKELEGGNPGFVLIHPEQHRPRAQKGKTRRKCCWVLGRERVFAVEGS